MRYLEITLLLFGAVLPFLVSSYKNSTSFKKISLLLIAIAWIGHAAIEGMRWQMIPIYLVNFILIICLIKNFSFFKGGWLRKFASGFFLLLFLGLGFTFSKILPVFDFPTPKGNYPIGSQYIYFESEREETITEAANDKRQLMIKVWYPAAATNQPKEKYLDQAERQGFAAKYGLPKKTFNYLDLVKTNTHLGPEVAEGKFPVLFFSPGYYSNATGYQALLEEIVSQGYIVLNINPTYESVGALFPANEIKLYDLEYDRKHNGEAMAKMAWEASENFKKAKNEVEQKAAIETIVKEYFATEITYRWTKDINELVDKIPAWTSSTFLNSHLDITKIGVFGHSQGGAAAGQSLLENAKIKAGINIDGVHWGNMIDTFFSKPFMRISSDWPATHPDFNSVIYQNKSRSDFYAAKIKQSGHASFMDIPFVANLPPLNEAGSIEPQKAIDLTAEMVVGFFDQYLKFEKSNFLEKAKAHPEVIIEKQQDRK